MSAEEFPESDMNFINFQTLVSSSANLGIDFPEGKRPAIEFLYPISCNYIPFLNFRQCFFVLVAFRYCLVVVCMINGNQGGVFLMFLVVMSFPGYIAFGIMIITS